MSRLGYFRSWQKFNGNFARETVLAKYRLDRPRSVRLIVPAIYQTRDEPRTETVIDVHDGDIRGA